MLNFVFDLDDTLYNQLIPFERAYKKNFGSVQDDLIELIYVYSRQFSEDVFEPSQRGEISMEDMYVYRLTKAFEACNLVMTPEQALIMQADYANFQQEIRISTEMEQTLNYCLKNQVSVAVITNGSEKHQKMKAKNLKLERWIKPENFFISGELKISKPNKKIFDYAAKKLNFVIDKTYYIGDSYTNDVLGAKKAGWRSIWLNKRNQLLKDDDIQPDYTIKKDQSLYFVVKKLVEQSMIK